MSSDHTRFQQFADAMANADRSTAVSTPPVGRVAVLGGAADGALVAALAVAAGHETVLFTAYGRERDALRGGVTLRGEGPIGTVATNPTRGPGIATTGDLDTALTSADVIVLTGPLHKQRTYAMVLADHLVDGQLVVLPNAGTFGGLEVRALLQSGGCAADVGVFELSNLPWWVERDGGALVLSAAESPLCATLDGDGRTHTAQLTPLFGAMTACVNHSHLAFGDTSAAIELPALLLGGPASQAGGPSVPEGAVARPEHRNFHSLLGSSQRALAQALLDERIAVAARFGVRDLPDLDAAVAQWAGAAQTGAMPSNGRRAVPTPEAALARVRDLIQASLQPLVDAASAVGVAVPNSVATVQLASTVYGDNLARHARSLDRLGVDGADADTARRQFDALIRESR
ncbi:MAG: hypothetical protein AAF460_06015 [Pseudomonadota bacterium]